MSTVARRYTPEDLLKMPDGDMYELVNGELLERKMGFESSRSGGRLFRMLDEYCEANGLGRVAPADASYQCFPDDPTMVRRPDVSFISFERLPASMPDPIGHCRIAPELSAEVTSPNDLFYEIGEKIDDYLAAGVRLVWVLDPRKRIVHVHRAGKPEVVIPSEGELSGDDVVPGFRCLVASLFPSPVVKS